MELVIDSVQKKRGNDVLRKLHIKFTLLFTIVSTLILTAMSIFYVYFNYRSLYKNALTSFQSDIITFSESFENSSFVSYDWLIKTQNNYNYSFYIYDNDIPFQFTNSTKTSEQKDLIKNLRKYFQQNYKKTQEKIYDSIHQEFLYKFKHEKYYVGVITVAGEKSNTEIYVVYPLETTENQIEGLYIRFTCIILVSAIVLFVFSWLFTKHLLKPVIKSHENQTQFIAAASHEIRNPVNTILSALNAMGKCNEQQRQEFVRIARNEGKRLSLLTDDLLMLARSDNHSFLLSFGSAELDTLILECYEAFLQPAREKKIQLSAELPETELIAENIDGERIKQVLSILLDNAISYTQENGKIVIRCIETTKTFVIEVEDNGPGIADKDKSEIFNRFYRADQSRESKQHFGLGLCIASEIINMHNGTISVKDTENKGATFVITLIK